MTDSRLPIEAVLFDLDSTLVDRMAGFERFCRELYHTSEIMRQTHTEEEAMALMASFDFGGQALRSRQDFFTDVIHQWPGLFQSLEQALRFFEDTLPRMLTLEPRTRELLEDLRERGIPTAIVTNGSSTMQASKIRHTGLDSLVQASVISEQAGVWKPDRRIFERALSLIDANPLSTVFVGDNPEDDILGAKGLGMRTAWIHLNRQWPHGNESPDYVLGHVSEMRNILLG